MCVVGPVSVPQRGVGIEVVAQEGQVAHFQACNIERVRDTSGLKGGYVDFVDSGTFPTS